MKIRTIRAASSASAIAGAGAAFLSLLAGWEWAAVPAVAVVVYFAAAHVMRRYVIFRIKPMYQILRSRDSKSGEIAEEYRGRDVVTEVEGELQAWAERNTLEIARLRENEQYRKEFVGNVSHELKTPLCSIQGYILTLLDGGLEDPDINRKYLEQTEKNIERLIHIVRDLEDISRLEAGTLELRRERFDLLALVDEIMQSLEMQAAERGIVLVSDAGPLDRLMVDADRARVGQVLINLLSNSIKYGKEGGRTRVRYVDMFEKVMVEVQDNGIGLTAEQLPRIFERFYRVDKSRSRAAGGTGLGLAIVKHILEAHKETITVRSTPDVGTTFSFTLAKA
ncbi:sensor histidine kinase [Rikenella microfusus]|uniref:sensor histidine kinase n=1 Tax=Rikenella microfusus TaxID=28139 RepID=UPI00248D702C|nr:ATP-binding protein [Rikenella microfusus]